MLRIATELLSILKYLGNLRPTVVHRDIKPENVVLEGGQWGGRVYLIDFGGVQGTATTGDKDLQHAVACHGHEGAAPGQELPANPLPSLQFGPRPSCCPVVETLPSH